MDDILFYLIADRFGNCDKAVCNIDHPVEPVIEYLDEWGIAKLRVG